MIETRDRRGETSKRRSLRSVAALSAAALVATGCTQATPPSPGEGSPYGPVVAIDWRTDDPTLQIADGVLFVSRGSGGDRELVALEPATPDAVADGAFAELDEFEELWSVTIGDALFALADDLFEASAVAVVQGSHASLLDPATGDVRVEVDLPGDGVSITVETSDAFHIGHEGPDVRQSVLTSTGESLLLEDWVEGFPDGIGRYGALHDWVLPAGDDGRGMLHIRGDDFRWEFDGDDPELAAAFGGDDYRLLEGVQGYSAVFAQYARSGADLERGSFTHADVAVAQIDDGELIEVHAGAVLCGTGICQGDFAVVDGIVQPGADVTLSHPDADASECAPVAMPGLREFPRSSEGVLPGGDYAAVRLDTPASAEGEAGVYVRHGDDPLGIGADAVVPCRRVHGTAGAVACSASGAPVADDDVPSRIITLVGESEIAGHTTLHAAVTDQHILLVHGLVIE